MKIIFDNQTIEYRFSISNNVDNNGVKIDIIYPHSFTLKNEERLETLKDAILHDNDEIIQLMIMKVAKDGKAIEEVESIFEAPISFDSLNLTKSKASFFFSEVRFNPDTKVEVEPKELEKYFRPGVAFSVIPK